MVTPSLPARLAEATRAVAPQLGEPPQVGVILGSGLGPLADELASPVIVPYAEIPFFPVPQVAGHAGRLVAGRLEEVPVLAFQGRPHLYEGYSPQDLGFPVRLLRQLGATELIVTNAAGGLNPGFAVGDLMVVADHLNLPGLVGQNPLLGPHDPALGVRFLDLTAAYDPELARLAQAAADEAGVPLRRGVYVMVAGPTYETAAEVRMLRLLGGDAVGMSTVPEVIVAHHCGLRVLAISCITDIIGEGGEGAAVSHEDVVAVARQAASQLSALVRGVVRRLRRA